MLKYKLQQSDAVFVGLDGWHYSNNYLAAHHINRNEERILLRSIKGAPETFDAAAAYDCLSKIRRGDQVRFPVYSRRLHEPIPSAGTIDTSHRIAVIEGNYLLLDGDPWRRFRQLFDVPVFISADPETIVDGLRARHQRGGKTRAATERQIREVDLPNAQRVSADIVHAQLIVHKTDTRRIDRIEQR